MVIRVDVDGIKTIPSIPLESMSGIDGDDMKEIAKEIMKERLEEIKHEEYMSLTQGS